MADILLINPPLHDTMRMGKLDNDEHWSPPLGLAYIAAVLEQHGFDVRVHDLYYAGWEQARAVVEREAARIVGISCFSEQRASTFRLAELVRSARPDTLIVAGGPHTNFLYEQVLQSFPIDLVCFGESEYTFLDVARAAPDWGRLRAVPGLAWKRDGRVERSAARPRIDNLDALPFPAYDHFRDVEYASRTWFRDLKVDGRYARDLKWTALIASRGCSYDCSFCSTPAFWERKWRTRSPANVVDEIVWLKSRYGYEFVDFSDDTFSLNKTWAQEVCRELLRRRVSVAWNCCTRVDAVDEELLRLMKEAGCLFVAFGVESFSSKVLSAVNKRQSKDTILRARDLCVKVGLETEYLLLVGSPGETDETIEETVALVRQTRPFAIQPSILTLFPGTGLYERKVREGFLSEDYWLADGPCPYDTSEHDLDTLKRWHQRLSSLDQMDRAERPGHEQGATR